MNGKYFKMTTALTLASVFVASTVFAATVTINSDGLNSGKTALAIFQQYLGSDPIDGPTDSGHLYESTSSSVGNVFMFKAGTASDTAVLDGSNTDRQRIEVKAYNSSPSNVTATNGQTVTYKWQFRAMSPYPMPPTGNFHHIFQLKAQDGDDGAPILTFSLDGGYLKFRHNSGTKDNWRDGATINRPKWGIYRKIYSGMPEAKIQIANIQITE
jgi:hypothetical protein